MTENKGKLPCVDPAYKRLSYVNGKINVMSKSQLIEQLELLKLNSNGVKEVLMKRLKSHHKKRLTSNPKSTVAATYDYFVVIDFEATCDKNVGSYRHEIIEFPAVLVDAAKKEIVDEFHSYVRPSLNPKLTDFCTELTGISQDVVDRAPAFPEVLEGFEGWLEKHDLGKTNKFAIVTDGPWDMSRFMFLQCNSSKMQLPRWSLKWINIRKSYANSYDRKKVSLKTMLEGLSLEFEGRAHSGISDSRNIARILIQMIRDDCNLYINEMMHRNKVYKTNDRSAKNGQQGKFVSVSRKKAETIEEDDDDGDGNDDGLEDGEADEDHNEQSWEHVQKKVSRERRLLKEDETKKLREELESCEDLMYYMSLRKS